MFSRKLLFTLRILLGLALITYLLLRIDLVEGFKFISPLKIHYLILAPILVFLGIMISTLKWGILIFSQKFYPKIRTLLKLYFVGYFFNNILPSTVSGDTIKGYYLTQSSKIPFSQSYASVILERLTGLSIFISFLFIGIFFNRDLMFGLTLLIFFLVFGGVFLILIFLLFNSSVRKFIDTRLDFKKGEVIIKKFKRVFYAVNVYAAHKKSLLVAWLLSLIFHILVIVTVSFYILALGSFVHPLRLLLIVPAVGLIRSIPVSIGGLGLAEGAYVYFFTQVGLSATEALSVALLARFTKIIVSLPGGFFYIFMRSRPNNRDLK